MSNVVNKIKDSIVISIKDVFSRSSFISYALLNIVKLVLSGFNLIISIFTDIKVLGADFKKAGLNNYKLGKEMLLENNFSGAKFRFTLANIFRPRSPAILYHLALVYFEEKNIKKSLICIQKVIKLRKNFKPALELFRKIDIGS